MSAGTHVVCENPDCRKPVAKTEAERCPKCGARLCAECRQLEKDAGGKRFHLCDAAA